MAINKRTYPNDYFAWYNDDTRLAILTQDTTNDSSERTTERFDTFQGTGDITGTITDIDGDGTTATATCNSHGLANDDRVTISGSTNYNGDFTVTVTNANTFTFSDPSDGSSDNETGSFTSLFINDGLRITYHAKYESVSAITDNLQTGAGVDSGLHPAIVCFVKSRLYEDLGDMEKSSYFRKMYEKVLMQYPSRKSGVRTLSVPHM